METLELWRSLLEMASAIVVCVGIPFAVVQLIAQKQQQHHEFENLYVQRYWQIMDMFSADYRIRGKRDGLSDSDLLASHAYLQLCEDEAELYVVGRITKETWAIWKSGIDWMLQQPEFGRMLEQSATEKYTTLRRYISEGKLTPRFQGPLAKMRGL